MREIFIAPRDKVLVGCDLASAQLRLLAAAMGDKTYSETVIAGKESEGTDVHTVNQRLHNLEKRTMTAINALENRLKQVEKVVPNQK